MVAGLLDEVDRPTAGRMAVVRRGVVFKVPVVATRLVAVGVILFVGACTSGGSVPDRDGSSPQTSDQPPSVTGDTSGVPETGTSVVAVPTSESDVLDTSACALPGAATEPIDGVVRLGTISPTGGGVAAAASTAIADGIRLYVDHANRNGLVPGIRFELVVEDDGFDPGATIDAMERLADADVAAVVGAVRPPGEANSLARAAQRCVPVLNDFGDPPPLAQRADVSPWFTSMRVPFETEGRLLGGRAAVESPGADVGLILGDDRFGAEFGIGFSTAVAAAGSDIDTETVPTGDLDAMQRAVDDVAKSEPEVVLLAVSSIQCAAGLRAVALWRDLLPDWTPTMYVASPCTHRAILAGLAGDGADGVVSATSWLDAGDSAVSTTAGVGEFLSAFEAADLTSDRQTTALGWSAAESAVAAVERASAAGPVSRATLMAAARSSERVPTLAIVGVVERTGADDPYVIESMQLVQWTRPRQNPIGVVLTEFEH